MLRVNLVSVFMVDELRRILCEAILPYLYQNRDTMAKKVQKKIQRSLSLKGKEDTQETQTLKVEQQIVQEELAELDKDEVEQFDDYLEMVMTYGYITLFAAAFPLGTTVTSIFIYLETKSDMFKFETTARRPLARKAHDIGTWEIALDILSI